VIFQAGLDIMAGLAELGRDGLEARCGVHSGPVVVGELGVGEKRLCDGIVGEAPNIIASVSRRLSLASGKVTICDEFDHGARNSGRAVSRTKSRWDAMSVSI
jgi:class 3 adenylate cyclase